MAEVIPLALTRENTLLPAALAQYVYCADQGRRQVIDCVQQENSSDDGEGKRIRPREWHANVVAGWRIKLLRKGRVDQIEELEAGRLLVKAISRLLPNLALCALFSATFLAPAPHSSQARKTFHFELLGDRTGEAQAGVFEEALKEAAGTTPAFILTVGDSIEGGNDSSAEAEWERFESLLNPYRRISLFLTPGNHDVWSDASARLFTRHAHHPLHYSFDRDQAHFVILNSSRASDGVNASLSPEEMDFLEKDLAAHASQPVKFVVSHRPTWLVPIMFGNRELPFHRLMVRYGVKYVIAGHIHQMLHMEMDGVTYLDMASSGGHLRDTKTYERGWFFEHTTVTVEGDHASFAIHELQPPLGRGRVTSLESWSTAGLAR